LIGTVATSMAAAALVLTASPASAHDLSVSATATCAEGGGYLVSYTATAWAGDGTDASRTNPNVIIGAVVNGFGSDVDSGAFTAPSFSFSDQFVVPATTTTLTVTSFAAAPWGDGFTGTQFASTPVDLPTDCTPGGEGCTPGFWKNHTEEWEAYSPNQSVTSVFSAAGAYGSLGTQSLLTALAGGGGSGVTGGVKILLRAAVAGILNATDGDIDYPTSAADLIADVNAALASGDRATMLSLATDIDADNNLGCTATGGGGVVIN
jgi:hypothetical protein